MVLLYFLNFRLIFFFDVIVRCVNGEIVVQKNAKSQNNTVFTVSVNVASRLSVRFPGNRIYCIICFSFAGT